MSERVGVSSGAALWGAEAPWEEPGMAPGWRGQAADGEVRVLPEGLALTSEGPGAGGGGEALRGGGTWLGREGLGRVRDGWGAAPRRGDRAGGSAQGQGSPLRVPGVGNAGMGGQG